MNQNGLSIECFSCSGGMAEGFRRAGVTFDFVFDKDPNAVASYTKNLGHAPIQMDVRDLMRMVRGGWSPGPVRLFVADPPCTPWSRAGKRKGLDDERDMLRETADLIAALRPQFYLIGNVPGLQDSTSWGVVQEVIGGLVAHGYCVADYVSLDAADYGVPQHRVRPFWFGHLGGACIRWPAPTHGAPSDHLSLPGMGALEPWVTCRQALQHLPLEELGRPVRLKKIGGSQDPQSTRPSTPDKPAPTITAMSSGGGMRGSAYLMLNDRHPPALEGAPAPTVGAKDRGQSTVLLLDNPNQPSRSAERPMATVTPGGRGHTARLEWPWDRPSTVVYTPPGHHSGSMLTDPKTASPNAVVLSERAAAILQGFPDGWLFSGETKKARWSQIGQAMPPPVGRGGGACSGRSDGARRERRRRVRWLLSHRADQRARVVADRHYNRQRIGAPQFVPPGRCLVLRTADAGALWVTSWPFAEYVKHEWPGAWINSAFRNERRDLYLSSELIREAVAATRYRWPLVPPLGMVSFVDPDEVKHKRDPGRCFVKAGFVLVGTTKGGLLAFQMTPDRMPPAEAAIGAQGSLGCIAE